MSSDAHAPAVYDDGSDFVSKWRSAWPEWAIAEVFVPAAQRPVAPFWQALQFELQEAAWGGGDARPGEVKLGWWMEELAGWSQGRRRHPLGTRLLRPEVPWSAIARALPSLAASRDRQAGVEAALRSLEEVSGAVAAAENALLGGGGDARMVAACWLQARLARHPAGLAGSSATPADWASELGRQWPSEGRATAVRRLESAIARARLRSGNPSQPCGPLRTLWACWGAARD